VAVKTVDVELEGCKQYADPKIANGNLILNGTVKDIAARLRMLS
jgi:hypothetical protein